MFFVLPLLRWLARHPRGWMATASGLLLLSGAVAAAAVGIANHQPAITRIGFFILIITIVYATIALRGGRAQRHPHSGPNDDG